MRVLLVCFCLLISIKAISQPSVDSLLQASVSATAPEKADIFLKIAQTLIKDSAKANFYNQKAYEIAVANNLKKQQAQSVCLTARILFTSRNFTDAIRWYEKAIPLYQALKDTTNMTTCYSYIGISNFNLSKNEEAIAAYFEGLRLSKSDLNYSAELLANIGLTHDVMDNFPEAISYYKQALAINQSISDTGSMAINYDYLGITYNRMKKTDSSLINYNKALILFKKLKKEDRYAVTLNNTAWVLQNYPDSLDKAIRYFNAAWKKFQELGWNHYEPDINQGIASILNQQGKHDEAIALLKKSIVLANKLKREFLLKKNLHKSLAEAYQKKGDYKNALESHILYTQYNDSATRKEKFEQISRLEKQYETEKKQSEILVLKSQQELMNVQLNKNQQLKIMGFVSACILLVFAMYVLFKYYDKLKLNSLLENKNKTIEKSEKELRKLNTAKNKFFSIIAHDLKNPFHTVMGYTELLDHYYEKFTEKERRKFATDINQSATNIFRLLQNLLEWAQSQTGRLTFEPSEVEFRSIFQNVYSVVHSSAELKNIDIEQDFDSNLTLYADPHMLETVLRNLISNAIKFTPESGKITVCAKQKEDSTEIRVSDTGVGISKEEVQHLFKLDSSVKRNGTNDEDGTGLGLILCYEFIQKHNGTIAVESEPGKGSSFYFIIPNAVQAKKLV